MDFFTAAGLNSEYNASTSDGNINTDTEIWFTKFTQYSLNI